MEDTKRQWLIENVPGLADTYREAPYSTIERAFAVLYTGKLESVQRLTDHGQRITAADGEVFVAVSIPAEEVDQSICVGIEGGFDIFRGGEEPELLGFVAAHGYGFSAYHADGQQTGLPHYLSLRAATLAVAGKR